MLKLLFRSFVITSMFCIFLPFFMALYAGEVRVDHPDTPTSWQELDGLDYKFWEGMKTKLTGIDYIKYVLTSDNYHNAQKLRYELIRVFIFTFCATFTIALWYYFDTKN